MASSCASTSRVTLSVVHHYTPAQLPPLIRIRSISSATTTPPTPTSTNRRARAASKRLSSHPGSNLVGPADPISNLRPIIYGSAFQSTIIGDEIGGKGSNIDGTRTDGSAASPHPYSTSEFNTLPSLNVGPNGFPVSSSLNTSITPSWTTSRSAYQTSLLHRLEAAEMAHHLRRARADRFSQDFWEDNNRRYARALEEYRRSIYTHNDGSTTSPMSSTMYDTSGTSPSPISTRRSTPNPRLSEDLLSPFYSAWLKANAKRHQAYNQRLWEMTKEDLIPAANYAMLRAWATYIVRWEARLKRWWAAGRGVS